MQKRQVDYFLKTLCKIKLSFLLDELEHFKNNKNKKNQDQISIRIPEKEVDNYFNQMLRETNHIYYNNAFSSYTRKYKKEKRRKMYE